MTARRRGVIAVGATALALLAAVAGAFVARTTADLIAPAHVAVGPPPAVWNGRTISIESSGGIALAGWYAPAASDASPVAVLLHPIRGSRRSMVPVAESFLARGFAVLAVDLRGHGESGGDRVTAGYDERHDAAAAVAWARAAAPGRPLVVYGRSLGGAAALLASPLDVDALVLESVYPTLERAVRNRLRLRLGRVPAAAGTPALLALLRLRTGIPADALRPEARIADAGCPVLILAGGADRRTTPEDSRRLFDAAAGPRELVVFEGARHVDLLRYDRARWEAAVFGFLARHGIGGER